MHLAPAVRRLAAGRPAPGLAAALLTVALPFLTGIGDARAGEPHQAVSRFDAVIDGTTVETHIHNAAYAFIWHNPLHPDDRGIILRYETDVQASNAQEGEQGKVSAEAFRLQADGSEVAAWKGTFSGSRTEIRDQRLIVTTPGCCGALASHTAVSLGTGKVLYTASGDSPGANVATLEIPNTGALGLRYIAVHGIFSSTDEKVLKTPAALALITYASPATPMQRMMVMWRQDTKPDDRYHEVKLSWIANDPNKVDGKQLVLWQAEGKRDAAAVTGAAARIEIGDLTITLPVVGDRFDLASATVPPNLVLVAQPLD